MTRTLQIRVSLSVGRYKETHTLGDIKKLIRGIGFVH